MLPGKKYTPTDLIAVIKRRFWLLPLPVMTLFAALVYSSTLPDVYQSNMLIAIVPQRVPNEFVRSTVTLRTEERLNTIAVQVRSRSTLEPIINDFELYPQERARFPMEDVVQMMQDDIDVGLERPTSSQAAGAPTAFHVRFTYQDPNLAARVTQRLGSIFVDQNARDRGALAMATDEFLQVQLIEARQRLEAQEKKVEAFRQRHGNELPTQLQSNLQAIQNAQMQIQGLVEAIARDRDRKLMLERLYQEAQKEPTSAPAPSAVPPTPATAGTAAPQASPRQQLAAARTLLASLGNRLTPEHPDIVRTKRLIAELEATVAKEVVPTNDATVAPSTAAASPEDAARRERLLHMRAEIESLDRLTQFKESEERRLRDLVGEYQRRIEAVPGIESEWAVLNRDYETQQATYKELLSKSDASKVALDLENRQIGENFRVLDPARVPVNPVSPRRIQISGLGLALGFALAIGIAVLLELKDATFRSETEIVSVLAVPVLATVPFVETGDERRRRVWRYATLSVVSLGGIAGAGYVFWTMRLWTLVI
jgi:polysaccharide chain length determinant protein (PEP-CTERM system associated)